MAQLIGQFRVIAENFGGQVGLASIKLHPPKVDALFTPPFVSTYRSKSTLKPSLPSRSRWKFRKTVPKACCLVNFQSAWSVNRRRQLLSILAPHLLAGVAASALASCRSSGHAIHQRRIATRSKSNGAIRSAVSQLGRTGTGRARQRLSLCIVMLHVRHHQQGHLRWPRPPPSFTQQEPIRPRKTCLSVSVHWTERCGDAWMRNGYRLQIPAMKKR